MLDRNKLLGAMATAGFSQTSLAAKMQLSKNTISAKLNGKGCFDTKQIDFICDILHIADDREKAQIFLAPSSHNRDERHGGSA